MDRIEPQFLRAFAETRGFTLGQPNRFQISADEKSVFFLRSGPRDAVHALFELDVSTGQVHQRLAAADLLGGQEERLSAEEKARRERQRITDRGLTSFALSPDGSRVLVPLSGRLWLHDRATAQARPLTGGNESAALDARFSPDGQRVAFVRDFNLWIVDVDGTLARPLTTAGSSMHAFGLAEFVAQEEMARFEGYWWSPASDSVACTEVDDSEVERLAIADPAHPERPPTSFAYPRPGKSNARVGLTIVFVDGTRAPVRVAWDQLRYPYLARVLWTAGAPLSLLVQTRDQREVALLAVDEARGATRPLLVERDEAWVNLSRDLPRWFPDGSGFLWASEACGRRQLELHRPDGALERVVIDGFLSLVHADAQTACVLTGDSVHSQIRRLELRGPGNRLLADEAADHALVVSSQGNVMVDVRTSTRAWPEVVVRNEARVLHTVPSAAESPSAPVNLELVTLDEVQGMRACVIRPRAFVPGKRYPVIVHVYGGPHALMVKADQRAYLFDQALADAGTIVVAMDGRGTPRRDRAWERAIKGRLAELPLQDQVDGLRALGRRFVELDLDRVGIYGWSFGGTMAALAVMCRPDVFHVAVAGAPVTDWRDYDTHYTERYLDLPDADAAAYARSSPLHHAAGLGRPLLLIHGTADDNVYFFHSLKLADALLRAGRSFDFLPLPGITHQIGDLAMRAEVWSRISHFLLSHFCS